MCFSSPLFPFFLFSCCCLLNGFVFFWVFQFFIINFSCALCDLGIRISGINHLDSPRGMGGSGGGGGAGRKERACFSSNVAVDLASLLSSLALCFFFFCSFSLDVALVTLTDSTERQGGGDSLLRVSWKGIKARKRSLFFEPARLSFPLHSLLLFAQRTKLCVLALALALALANARSFSKNVEFARKNHRKRITFFFFAFLGRGF